MPPFDSRGAYYSQAPQIQQHELARLRQTVAEIEQHRNHLHSQLTMLATRVKTADDQLAYVRLLSTLNDTNSHLDQHVLLLNEMLSLVPNESGRQVSDHAKREIYHLYHASRYTQEALAGQYGVSQSTVNRIVNGPAPPPLRNVNTASLG